MTFAKLAGSYRIMEIDKVPINSIVRFNNVMPNYSPNTQGLKENRGVKPSLNKKEYSIKLSPEKKADLEKIAQEFGFKHGGKGSLSALLEAIADDELMLVQTPLPVADHLVKTIILILMEMNMVMNCSKNAKGTT